MGASRLIFRSKHQPWSVWGCACGCDAAVRLTAQQEADCLADERYYVRHHGPLGASPDRIGPRYDFTVDETERRKVFDYPEATERITGPLSDFQDPNHAEVPPDWENEPTGEYGPIWSDLLDD